MPQRKKTIRYDEIVDRFAQRLRELGLTRGMSQAELARHAEVTTNYTSRLEGGGTAPGIDLAARLAAALGVAVAELLPTTAADDLAVTRQQAKRLFDELLRKEDRAVLLLLTQLLARLAEATNR